MKRILCLAVTIVVIASAFTCAVGAVSYSDLEPTYSVYSDYTDYVNSTTLVNDSLIETLDDRLQKRSNCYGFVMRLHYSGELPSGYDCYKQMPGEFYDKSQELSAVSFTTYQGILEYCYADRNNDSLAFDVYTIYQLLCLDAQQLGYSVTYVAQYDAHEEFTPPVASANSNMRLVALVESASEDDFHFYMQSNDNKWTHKPAHLPASTTCGECKNANGDYVSLTNSNISAHVNCMAASTTSEYNGRTLLFYISAPGSSDRYHHNGFYADSAKTPTSYHKIPGDFLRSAMVIEDADTETIGGHIDYIGDEDYFIFNVPTTGSYIFTFTKGNKYAYRFYIGEVADSFTMIETTVHTLTASTESVDFTKTLQAGKRYYMKVIAYGQTEFDYLISYGIFIN